MAKNYYDPNKCPKNDRFLEFSCTSERDKSGNGKRTMKQETEFCGCDCGRRNNSHERKTNGTLHCDSSIMSTISANPEDIYCTNISGPIYELSTPFGKKLVCSLVVPVNVAISADGMDPQLFSKIKRNLSLTVRNSRPPGEIKKQNTRGIFENIPESYTTYCVNNCQPCPQLLNSFDMTEPHTIHPIPCNCTCHNCGLPHYGAMDSQKPVNTFGDTPPKPASKQVEEFPAPVVEEAEYPEDSLIEPHCPAYDYLTFNQFYEITQLLQLPRKGIIRFIFLLLLTLIYFFVAFCFFFYLSDKLQIEFHGTTAPSKTTISDSKSCLAEKNLWDVLKPQKTDLWRQCF